MRARDTQQSRLYEWERAEQLLPLQAIVEVGALRALGWKMREQARLDQMPQLLLRNRSGGSTGGASRISLSLEHRSLLIMTHEFTHHIISVAQRRVPVPTAAHGPEFVGMYIHFIARNLGGDMNALVASADAAGLEFTHPANIKPHRPETWSLAWEHYFKYGTQ